MKAKKQKRGRPAVSSEEEVLSNGLFRSQWKRIQKEAQDEGLIGGGAIILRRIVTNYLKEKDLAINAALEAAEVIDGAIPSTEVVR